MSLSLCRRPVLNKAVLDAEATNLVVLLVIVQILKIGIQLACLDLYDPVVDWQAGSTLVECPADHILFQMADTRWVSVMQSLFLLVGP